MIKYLFTTLFGVATGIITGLVPGIHPNTVTFVSLPIYFSTNTGFLTYMSYIAGLSVCHTFLDFLPAITLGTPQAEEALSALPGVRMTMQGRGIEAFYYTLFGGIFSAVILVFAMPFLFLFLDKIYGFVEPYMAYILVFFLLVTLFESKNVLYGSVLLVLTGALGLFTFQAPINKQYALLPVFSGLFAVPYIIDSVTDKIDLPEQKGREVREDVAFRGGFFGVVAGVVSGIFPGISAAISTSFLAPFMQESEKEFLSALGAVNTSNILVSFVTLALLGKARSGSSVALKAISEITPPKVVFLFGTSLFAVAASIIVALRIPKIYFEFLDKISLRNVFSGVLAVIVVSVVLLTGPLGILVLSTASAIGYNALLVEERRVCMAVLIVPAIFYFADVGIFM